MQYDINGEAVNISALSSGKIDKYEFLACEEILLSDQSRIMEQSEFPYSPLGKVFKKKKQQQKWLKNKEDSKLKQLKNM